MLKKVVKFFDVFEDRVRGVLSHRPILYSLIGGAGIVLFWRGIWNTTDLIPILNSGPVSIIVSLIILLSTGLFVSFFIGDQVIISGVRREKKLVEKTELEVRKESVSLLEIKQELKDIKEELKAIKDR